MVLSPKVRAAKLAGIKTNWDFFHFEKKSNRKKSHLQKVEQILSVHKFLNLKILISFFRYGSVHNWCLTNFDNNVNILQIIFDPLPPDSHDVINDLPFTYYNLCFDLKIWQPWGVILWQKLHQHRISGDNLNLEMHFLFGQKNHKFQRDCIFKRPHGILAINPVKLNFSFIEPIL
jgi:hypothetical protein